MKEVFLLPTKNETPFPFVSDPSERKTSPLRDGEKTFREYLEQVKGTPSQPASGKPSQETPRAQKSPQNDNSAQPEEDGNRAEAVDDKQPSPESGEAEPEAEVSRAALLAIPAQLTAVEEQKPVLDLSALAVDQSLLASGDGENEGQSVGISLVATDLTAQTSTPLEGGKPQTDQTEAVGQTFGKLIQAQDVSDAGLQEAKVSDEIVSQLKAHEKSDLQSLKSVAQDTDHLLVQGNQGGNAGMANQILEAEAREKNSPSLLKAHAQAGEKIEISQVDQAGERESLQAATKEGARPEAVQASGPPLNAVANKPIEPARLAEAHRPEIVQQVARELEIFGKSGQNSLRIQLYPEQLGRIDVRLISKNDGVQIIIHADNASTASLLERDLNFLRENLAQAGVNLSGLTVGNSQTQAHADLAQNEFRSPSQNGGKLTAHLAHEEPSKEPLSRGWRDSSSTLDYRI